MPENARPETQREPPRDNPRTVAVWTSAERVALVREVVTACGLTVSQAGSPHSPDTRRVASELRAAPEDDLRRLVVDPDGAVNCILLADLAEEPALDARTLAQASAKGAKIASLEPIPHSALALTSGGWVDAAQPHTARSILGLLRHSRAARDAAEILERFTSPHAAMFESLCGPHEGSLGARLFDALDSLHAIMGEAETITASFTPAPGAPAAPPDGLIALSGTISATLRFASGRTASVFASNRAASWRRSSTILAAPGRLTLTDAGFEWRDESGAVVDLSSQASEGPTWTAFRTLSEALARFLDPAAPAEAPTDLPAVLSMAQAVLLAARTSQPESPATIRRMVGLPEK
ncbi:MAG: hypothetical protein HEQ23_13630 [Tepidisphaera sp.]|jgi:hypothetical protein